MRPGLERASWEGRLEQVAKSPAVFLDGAHNPASAGVLADALRDLRKEYSRCVLVLGILKDKDWQGILDRLLPLADLVVVTRPRYSRAMDVGTLAAEVRRTRKNALTAESLADAISLGKREAGRDGLVVVTGSLYTVGDARAVLCPDSSSGPLKELKG
jgi:dihydrofolate synthase/folylpolyglutamate synthase